MQGRRRGERAQRAGWIVVGAGLLGLGAGAAAGLWRGGSTAVAQEAGVAEIVGDAVADMEGASPEALFSVARELDRLGPSAIEPARAALASANARAKVGLARYLLGQNERQPALDALVEAVRSDDAAAAALAAEMFERHARTKREVQALQPALKTVRDPAVKIAIAKALVAKARDDDASQVLKDYLTSDSFDVRAMAALALGDLDNVAPAKLILSQLAEEPTERGKRARSILYQETLIESLQRTQGLDPSDQVKLLEAKVRELEAGLAAAKKAAEAAAGEEAAYAGYKKGQQLVDELAGNIKRYYVDETEDITDKALYDAAAKGMVGGLDPFSSYMTEAETKQFNESISGKYAGIGAVVSMDPKDKLLTIIRPIYSGPAYRAGLRSMDKITQVEDQSTFGKSVEDLVSVLKGDPGTEVKIKVYRKGWKKERDLTLIRQEIQLESVHFEMLPGNVGYLQLAQFGNTATEEVETALATLEAAGMKALIFDMRANPGGLLTAAVEIADKFLKDDKLIVYSQGRNPHIAPRKEYRTKDAATHPDYPMVVLVNKASASASEIVSGALQEHKRAILVGENTFGKGSVQQLLKVRTTSNESTLRLTIAKYYLPSGRSIHRDVKTKVGGVDPDIVVEEESRPAWEIEEADRIRETGKFEPYIEQLWNDHRDLCKALAIFDASDASKYPGFDAFHASLETALGKPQLRTMVRAQLRRLAQDERGKEFPHDLQEDVQLQRGVYEALKRAGADAGDFTEYKHFAQKFAEAPRAPAGEGEVR